MAKQKIPADYVRGFFDGEGCIYFSGKNSARIVITNTNKELIKDINAFLDSIRIKNRIAFTPKKKNIKTTKDIYRVMISSTCNVYKFWIKIGTFESDKKKKFEEYFSIPKISKKIKTIRAIPKIFELSRKGLTLDSIADKTGVCDKSNRHKRQYIFSILKGRIHKQVVNDYLFS